MREYVQRSLPSRMQSSMLLACCAFMTGCNFITTVDDFPMAAVLWQSKSTPLEAARTLEREGKLDEALAAYQELSQRSDCATTAWHRMAVVHDRLGNYEQAAQYFASALEANNSDPQLLCDYGYSCYLQGNLEEAESSLKRALEIQIEMPRARNNLGLVYARQGRRSKAENEFLLAGCTDDGAMMNWSLATLGESPRSAP